MKLGKIMAKCIARCEWIKSEDGFLMCLGCGQVLKPKPNPELYKELTPEEIVSGVSSKKRGVFE